MRSVTSKHTARFSSLSVIQEAAVQQGDYILIKVIKRKTGPARSGKALIKFL